MSSYAHQFDNLYEKDQFFERHNLSNLAQEELTTYIDLYILKKLNE